MGLADAGGAADEQRVVGLRGHLGDGQGGGVGEAVAVADDELLEGELGVAERRRCCWCGGTLRVSRRRAVRRAGVLRSSATAAAWWSLPPASGAAASSTLDVGPEDELDAGLDRPSEALADPAARVRRGLDEQVVIVELDRAQRLEPDAVGGLVDDERKLGLHPRPYVLELVAHGSGSPLLSQRQC